MQWFNREPSILFSERTKLKFIGLDGEDDVKCVLGQTLVIVVELEGHPQPAVSWYHNGIEILDGVDSNFRMLSLTTGVYELRINTVDYNHEGTIKCRVRNIYEEITHTWRLHIEGECDLVIFLGEGKLDRR